MLILGAVLVILGFAVGLDVLVGIGVVLAVLGLALNVSGRRIY